MSVGYHLPSMPHIETGAQPMELALPVIIAPCVQECIIFFANEADGAKAVATAAMAAARTSFLIMFGILCQALDSGHENPRTAPPHATSGPPVFQHGIARV